MSSESVYTEIDARGVAALVLNRPKVHNAFDDHLIAELTGELERLKANREVRVVQLRANGKSFSAGADLNWMRRAADYSREENIDDAKRLGQLLDSLCRLDKPTVGVIQGAAYGGGVGLVACCDIVIASEQAKFCLSEVKLGLIPAVISPFVIRAIGARHARRYFLSAEVFDAAAALRLGLVHELVEPERVEETVEKLTSQLLKNGPQAMAAAKELVDAVAARPIDSTALADTAERIADRRASTEGREGVKAFLDKRKPVWPVA